MKYRLKKDLPDLEAGELFDDTDSFGHETSSMFDSRGAYRFDKDDIKHFDEWFEVAKEPKKEPTWVRKQIKRVGITALNKSGESGYKYTDVQYRFIKPFYYDDAECGVDVYAKNSTSYQRYAFQSTMEQFTLRAPRYRPRTPSANPSAECLMAKPAGTTARR